MPLYACASRSEHSLATAVAGSRQDPTAVALGHAMRRVSDEHERAELHHLTCHATGFLNPLFCNAVSPSARELGLLALPAAPY
jgi:hypothetical protein